MAVTFISNALGGTTTTTSFSITLPATQANDIIVLEYTHRNTTDATLGGTYSGGAFTEKHDQQYATSTFSGKTLWSRATGNHNAQTVTGSSLTNSCAAIITIYRGALTTADPLADATIVGEQNASGDETQAQITTATNGAWVVLVVTNSPDLAVTTQACTSPGSLTARAEVLSTGGTDTSIAHASAEKVTAGATGAFTWAQTNGASGSWAYAIKPEPPAVVLAQRQAGFYEDGTEAASTLIAQDTIAIDAQSGLIQNGFAAGGDRTWSHTVVSGNHLFLVVSVQLWQDVAGTGTISGMTYAGVAMTKAQGVASTAMRAEIWYLENPTTGANNVIATVSGNTDDRKFRSVSYTGVGGFDASNNATGTTGNPSVAVTTLVNNCWVQDAVSKFTTTAATVGTDQTSVMNDTTGTSLGAASYEVKATAGAVTMDWTNAAATDWSSVAMSFRPAARITRNVDSDSNILLRARLQETNGGAGAATDDYQLQYSKGGGAYTNVTTVSSNVKAFASTNLTDGGASTNRLGSGTGSFLAGEVSEDGLVDDFTHTASNYTEHLYALTLVSADLANNNTLDFKLLRNGADITTYTITPRITVSKTGGATVVKDIISMGILPFAR